MEIFTKFFIFKVIIFFVFNFNLNVFAQSLELGRNDYEYILPTRKVTSCPSFASFRFSCQKNHVIGIESIIFAPALNNIGSSDCIPNQSAECVDDEDALNYAQQECSNSEHCTLISYLLRSKTKCVYHSVISVLYKCIPTWEVIDVPIKCDICKNITITNIRDSYGFIHSAWYPKLYPRVTCHSLIKTQPDKLIIIYSVSGSIGLDRIQIESINQYGQLIYRETLTGNLTTKRILVSAYDVNITVLPEDAYFFDQRRFLLYFYLIPRCHITYCPNINTTIPHPFNTSTPPTKTHTVHPPSSWPITQAPPLKGGNHSSKLSDAWLAAILALVYSLLMIIAVLTAIYCRRRRRLRIMNKTNVYNTSGRPGTSSSSQIAHTISRVPSQISMREPQLREYNRTITNPVYLASPTHDYDLYAQMDKEQQFQKQHHDRYDGSASVRITRNVPITVKANDFDAYSYSVGEDDRARLSERLSDSGGSRYTTEQNTIYQRSLQHYASNEEVSSQYAMKTNTQMGAIIGTSGGGSNNDSLKGIYRAVEYTKSPRVERVRIKNSEDLDDLSNSHHQIMHNNELPSHRYKIDARDVPIKVVDIDNNQVNYLQYQTLNTSTTTNEADEKTFVVKLFPFDENEKEIQEMTMFVESNDRVITRKY